MTDRADLTERRLSGQPLCPRQRAGLGVHVLRLRAAKAIGRQRAETTFIHNMEAFVRRFTRRYQGPDIEAEDLTAEATIACWCAAQTWQPHRSSFESWARWRMRGALQKLIRNSRMVRGVHHSRMVRSKQEL